MFSIITQLQRFSPTREKTDGRVIKKNGNLLTWVTGRSSWHVGDSRGDQFVPKTSKDMAFHSNTPPQAQSPFGIPLVCCPWPWTQSHALDTLFIRHLGEI